jgi:hypothetical protein
MPDITMCDGKGCQQAETCYRHRAVPNEFRQSFFVTAPVEKGVCTHYSHVEADGYSLREFKQEAVNANHGS